MKVAVFTAMAVLAAGPVTTNVTAQSKTAEQVRPTDEQLMREIVTKLANDETLSADAIKVTVKNGVVTLSGMVARDDDKAKAESTARVLGVVRIENKLTSRQKATETARATAGTVADAAKTGAEKTVEVSKKAAGKTKEVMSKTGEVITDGWITSRIKTKYLADETLRAASINVDTRDNVVTLRGAVPTEAARAKALALAKEVEGVDRVVDSLKVTGK